MLVVLFSIVSLLLTYHTNTLSFSFGINVNKKQKNVTGPVAIFQLKQWPQRAHCPLLPAVPVRASMLTMPPHFFVTGLNMTTVTF